MKKILAIALCLCTALGLAAGCAKPTDDPGPSGEGVSLAQNWIDKHIEENTLFSFKYDGTAFADFIKDWDKKVERGTDTDGNPTITLTYTETSDNVKVWADIVLWDGAIDWMIYFENQSSDKSKIISDIRALDSYYSFKKGEEVIVDCPNGSDMGEEDFASNRTVMTPDIEPIKLVSVGGRSSDEAMPYFDITTKDGGMIAAIGWTGQWSCYISATDDKILMSAGMETTNISLYAGESMRTPSIVLYFFEGDAQTGHNGWRQLMVNHYNPTDENGTPVTTTPIFCGPSGSASETVLLNTIGNLNNTKTYYEGIWIDAGWYGTKINTDTYDETWAKQVGSWEPVEALHPNKLKPIGDLLAESNKEFLLWFEPERVAKDTIFYNDYSDYLIPSSSASQLDMLDLSRDDVTDFLIDFINEKISSYGMTWYRQDFNCRPLNKWQYADMVAGPDGDRVGMTEIKYITNLYRFLDEIVAANPGLMIDNCASGGRRLDIEMMKRSLPLWRSDYYVSGANATITTEGSRNIGTNIAYWLPVSAGGHSNDGMDDEYEFRSYLGSGLTFYSTAKTYWHNEMMAQFVKIRPCYAGDYYLLQKAEDIYTDNCVFEYYLPDEGRGFLMAFRPLKSTSDSYHAKLKGLDTEGKYRVENMDTGETFTATGAQLMETGFVVSLATARTSALIYFEKTE